MSLVVRGGTDVHGTPLVVCVSDGVLADRAAEDAQVLDATGLVVLPGLLDLQVNGAVGHDLTADPGHVWDVAAALPAYGVTGFVPTVVSSDPSARAAALAVLAAGPPDGWRGAQPLGWHFEGPMIAPTRVGAHAPRWLAEPSLDLVSGWSRDRGVTMVTLAPELPRALDVVAALVSRGVVVSVGHTAATASEVRAAVEAGASAVTHLGNAMPALAAREPGPVGAALDSALVAGVIVDGHHLDPVVVRTFWRLLGPDRFLTVSDTTAALGLADGRTRLGDQDVVISGGTVRLDDGILAGSAASLADCLRVLIETTGCRLPEAVACATTTPARLLGDVSRGHLRPGARGDLVLVTPALEVVTTVVGGEVVT